jgi:hypothetical protein
MALGIREGNDHHPTVKSDNDAGSELRDIECLSIKQITQDCSSALASLSKRSGGLSVPLIVLFVYQSGYDKAKSE